METKVREGDEHPAIEGHLAKYRSLVPSLALLIYLATCEPCGPVSMGAVNAAIAWATYLESHARRIYAAVVDPAGAGARVLAAKIRKGDLKSGFTVREVHRRGWAGLHRPDLAQQAVEFLVELDWLVLRVVKTTKPKTVYDISPLVIAGDPKDEVADSADSSSRDGQVHDSSEMAAGGEVVSDTHAASANGKGDPGLPPIPTDLGPEPTKLTYPDIEHSLETKAEESEVNPAHDLAQQWDSL